ncbi:MAG TPA: PQQ-binding-like beta-propeller repeat protein [Candidatus Bathyarchaeia archaeon]|nr:PQQ-binding-like beta-propeller repeat protein [Candidatus Bathyarchaeia archaeon]
MGNASDVCCKFRGSVAALDAATGSRLWQGYTVNEPARPTEKNAAGTQLWGPSGAGIWSAPTVDAQLKVLYVGTGDNYSDPPTDTSDAILALDLDSGAIKWKAAVHLGGFMEHWLFDFGSSPILVAQPGGQRILIAPQKSGVVHALDPEQQGRVLWEVRVGEGARGVEWGGAADAENAYVAVSDVGLTLESGDKFELGKSRLLYDSHKGGGIFALRVTDGKQVWYSAPSKTSCVNHTRCSPAQSAAVSVIPGVVFSGAVDGHLRAYSTQNGRVVWDFDTVLDYATVNAVKARGGSLDGPGPTIVDGVLYTESGYGFWGGMAGNVLLAFSVDGK